MYFNPAMVVAIDSGTCGAAEVEAAPSTSRSSTPSSIGEFIEAKLLSLKLDARDDSPSVIEPKAESCDGLLSPRIIPRRLYSMRRDLRFLNADDGFSCCSCIDPVDDDVEPCDSIESIRMIVLLLLLLLSSDDCTTLLSQ
uniref:(northern house mosquito) hypothetical protein n=1 Tax=Culex pipiens TaxID=7175 RepID=A0A8D8A5H2_CULPI